MRLLCLLLLNICVATPTVNIIGDPVDNAVMLIKNGNMREFTKTFSPDVELSILNNENINPAQAEPALENFFKNNAVKTVSVVHRIASNPNIRYAVLDVVTATGTYRTSVSLKLVNGQFLVNELRIEAEKK